MQAPGAHGPQSRTARRHPLVRCRPRPGSPTPSHVAGLALPLDSTSRNLARGHRPEYVGRPRRSSLLLPTVFSVRRGSRGDKSGQNRARACVVSSPLRSAMRCCGMRCCGMRRWAGDAPARHGTPAEARRERSAQTSRRAPAPDTAPCRTRYGTMALHAYGNTTVRVAIAAMAYARYCNS